MIKTSKFIIHVILFLLLTIVFIHSNTLKTQIILAQKDNHGVDSRISNLVKKIEPFIEYNAFRLLSEKTYNILKNKKIHISMPKLNNLYIIPKLVESEFLNLFCENGGNLSFKSNLNIPKKGSFCIHSSHTDEGDIFLLLTYL